MFLKFSRCSSNARASTAFSSLLAKKKSRLLMKEDGCYPCYHFYFTHTLQYVPHEVSCNTSRYNRRSCCSLNSCRTIISNISHDCLIDIDAHLDCTSPKPSSICTGGPVEALSLRIQPRHSKAIFHLSPLIPSQLNPAVYWNSLYNSDKCTLFFLAFII